MYLQTVLILLSNGVSKKRFELKDSKETDDVPVLVHCKHGQQYFSKNPLHIV